jgi:sucrose-phosphate synthase
VFATGRHLAAVKDFLRLLRTRCRPDACICMVGTEIWIRRRFRYRLDRGWSQVIGAHWDRGVVLAAARRVRGLTLQHDEWQSDFKISWFVDRDDPDGVVVEVEDALRHHGIEVLLIHSGGNLLDALPVESGKGSAAAFLARRFGIRSDAIITAGDSGNDLDMMRPELGFRSIIVGNASPEMRRIEADHVYRAQAATTAGIREGLRHWGWLSG